MNTPLETPTPGIYFDVPFDEYLAWPCVNNSSLGYAVRSMAHYRYAPPMEATDAMRFGTLVHCGQLEPDELSERYVVMPDFTAQCLKPDGTPYANPKATRQYKELVDQWQNAHADREIVTEDWFTTAIGMVGAIAQNEFASQLLNGRGMTEVSLVWDDPDTDIRCKCRVDKLTRIRSAGETSVTLTDLKTTRDASQFEKAIANFAYHRQAAFYADGASAVLGETDVRFAIVAVEKEPPFGVRAAYMGDDVMAIGRAEYKRLLSQLAECRRTNDWPGYGNPETWDLPPWAKPASNSDEPIGISINGEVVL